MKIINYNKSARQQQATADANSSSSASASNTTADNNTAVAAAPAQDSNQTSTAQPQAQPEQLDLPLYHTIHCFCHDHCRTVQVNPTSDADRDLADFEQCLRAVFAACLLDHDDADLLRIIEFIVDEDD